jgi:hypothetical protein
MAHTLPPKRFRDGEPVDPEAFNQVFQETATKLAARLNEHDIDADKLKTTPVAVADEAYYDAHYIKRAADPNLTRGGGAFYAQPSSVAGEAVAALAEQGQWQSLTDLAGTQTMSLSMTTGEDTLVIIGQAQHFGWFGAGAALNAALTPGVSTPLRIQYALKVDDLVLDETCTGAFFWPDAPPQEWYRATPAATSAEFDYRHIQYIQDTVGTNNATMPVALFYAVPVIAGAHTVELVGRMLPGLNYKTAEDGDGVTVQVFNRQLLVLRIKGGSPYAGGTPDTVVSAFEDGQPFTLASVFTDAQYRLRDTLNDIEPRHIERGALRNEHLPTLIYGPKTKILTDASATAVIAGVYPGYATSTVAWTVVAGALGNLEVTGPTAGEWDLVANPGLFVVLVNVQVPYLKWAAAWGGSMIDLRALGILAIATTNTAGTRTVHGVTEAYVNAHNPDPYSTTTMHNIEVDIPLMLVLDSANLSTANKHIAKVEVLASVWNGVDGTAAVEVRCQRAGLCAFAIKGVHI